MRILIAICIILITATAWTQDKYIGNYNNNQFDQNSISNPYGQYGSKFSQDSVNNKFGKYGSPFSNQSANNPFATKAPKVYDSQGNYKGVLTTNPLNPDAINPYQPKPNTYNTYKIYGQ